MEYKRLPDLKGWAALRAVVEQGGVMEAAQALNIGQPAVTKRLRALDVVYGVKITERVGGRLRLTAVGEKLYLLAVQTLDRHAALQHDITRQSEGLNTLRVDVTYTIGEHFLPKLLIKFAEQYPQYKIHSRVGYSRQIQNNLMSGLADLALLEGAPEYPELLVQKWMDDELWLICSGRHELAGREFVDIHEMQSLSYVLREKRAAVREIADVALSEIGVQLNNIAMEVGSTDTIIEILRHGGHVSFLPRFAVEEKVRNGDLFHLKVSGFRIKRTLWIARNQSNIVHPVANAFIKGVVDWV